MSDLLLSDSPASELPVSDRIEPQLTIQRRPPAPETEDPQAEIAEATAVEHPAITRFLSQPLAAWHMAHDENQIRNNWLNPIRKSAFLVGAGIALSFSGFTLPGIAAAAGAYALGQFIGPIAVMRVAKKINPNTFSGTEKFGLTALTGAANLGAFMLNPIGWAVGNGANFLANHLAQEAARSSFIHYPETDRVPSDMIYNRDDRPPPPYRRGPVDLIAIVPNQYVERGALNRVSVENGRLSYVLNGETFDIDGLSDGQLERALEILDDQPGMIRLGNMVVPADAIHNAKLEHGQLFLNIAHDRLVVKLDPADGEKILAALAAMPDYIRIGNHVLDLEDLNAMKPVGLYLTIYEMWDDKRGMLSDADPVNLVERLHNHPALFEVAPDTFANTRFATRVALEDNNLIIEGVGGRSVVRVTDQNRASIMAKFDNLPGFTRIASDVLINPSMLEGVRSTGKGLEFLSQGRSFSVGLSPRQTGIALGRLMSDSRFTKLGDALINTSRPHRIALDARGAVLDSGGVRMQIPAIDGVDYAVELEQRHDVDRHPDGRLEIMPPPVMGSAAPAGALVVGGVRINPSSVTGVGYYNGELVIDMGATRVAMAAPTTAFSDVIKAVRTPVAAPETLAPAVTSPSAKPAV